MKCTRYFGRASKLSDPVCQSKRGSCGNKLSIIGKCPARYKKCRQGHLVKTTATTTLPSFDFDIDISSSFFPALEVAATPSIPANPLCNQPCTRFFGKAKQSSALVCQSKKGKCGNLLKIGKCPARYTLCIPMSPKQQKAKAVGDYPRVDAKQKKVVAAAVAKFKEVADELELDEEDEEDEAEMDEEDEEDEEDEAFEVAPPPAVEPPEEAKAKEAKEASSPAVGPPEAKEEAKEAAKEAAK